MVRDKSRKMVAIYYWLLKTLKQGRLAYKLSAVGIVEQDITRTEPMFGHIPEI